MVKNKVGNEKLIGIIIVVVFIIGLSIFFMSTTSFKSGEIPSAATGKIREAYIFAQEHPEILKQIPCYCGCAFEGHLNSYDCFWKADGTADRHGLTCSICVDIAIKSRDMFNQGKDICEIRNAIDTFYAANKDIATPTPMPAGCSV